MDRDLFGNPIDTPANDLEDKLAELDEYSFQHRLERLKYLQLVFPEGYNWLMSPNAFYLFQEVRITFVNGAFAGTILLSQAFIEQWLQIQLENKGYKLQEVNQGLKHILNCISQGKHLDEFIVKKIDRLRRIRNPFVHLKSFNDPFDVTNIGYKTKSSPDNILEKEAREALSLVSYVSITKLH